MAQSQEESAILMARDKLYAEAIAAFDQALKDIDEKLRGPGMTGTCFPGAGDHTAALRVNPPGRCAAGGGVPSACLPSEFLTRRSASST